MSECVRERERESVCVGVRELGHGYDHVNSTIQKILTCFYKLTNQNYFLLKELNISFMHRTDILFIIINEHKQ